MEVIGGIASTLALAQLVISVGTRIVHKSQDSEALIDQTALWRSTRAAAQAADW